MQHLLLAAYVNPDVSMRDMNARQVAFQNTPAALYEEIARVDLTKSATSFSVPIFLFQGSDDDLTPAPLAKAYLEQIKAPYKEYVPFAGGGHFTVWVMHERFGKELAARVRPRLAQF
jgi:pimeloyl-ACP methyl ester carboxylesterase